LVPPYFNTVISAQQRNSCAVFVGARFYYATLNAAATSGEVVARKTSSELAGFSRSELATINSKSLRKRIYIKRIRGYSNRRYLCFARRLAFRPVYNHSRFHASRINVAFAVCVSAARDYVRDDSVESCTPRARGLKY
jgi:hypothetical protein